ncbi:MAG: 23S rRNA pseudouridine(1911/1915/1917) synthase RluD [Gammaproteobacteria bacterium]|nr:23S rRNA pseudouridine(1911/1915/1917) synthase RluD [Gammaproteobacteria bacterium]
MKIPSDMAGLRLDRVLARLFPEYSRARLQQWVRAGCVLVNGEQWRPRDKVCGCEQVCLTVPTETAVPWQAQALPLNILYEDEDLLVIDKPAGMVVHPGAGNSDHTLVNALLHHEPRLAQLPRAGIIHRLDKDTSGILAVARRLSAHTRLTALLQARQFLREYQAVATGVMTAGGCVDAPMGRHPIHRTRMAVVNNGKPAVTHYRITKRYRAHTCLRIKLETGRTHQIRVHLAYRGYPLLGDPVYGGRLKSPADSTDAFIHALRNFRRQALHAARLGFIHPGSGESMEWKSPLPEDMQQLLELLKQDAMEHG